MAGQRKALRSARFGGLAVLCGRHAPPARADLTQRTSRLSSALLPLPFSEAAVRSRSQRRGGRSGCRCAHGTTQLARTAQLACRWRGQSACGGGPQGTSSYDGRRCSRAGGSCAATRQAGACAEAHRCRRCHCCGQHGGGATSGASLNRRKARIGLEAGRCRAGGGRRAATAPAGRHPKLPRQNVFVPGVRQPGRGVLQSGGERGACQYTGGA